MTSNPPNPRAALTTLLAVILALGTLACYWPVSHFDYVNLDDGVYVYHAPMVTRGLTGPGVAWAFTTFEGGNWNPLVWLSHMADCQFFSRPGGHHVTNLVLHIMDVLLLFLSFRSMTGAVWRSAGVAAVFAWHPMHVESVAWISERKDVLSTLFWLGASWAYAAYATGAGPRKKMLYSLALLLFALGLMCKSMLVTLPFVFLLLDYWPLRRAESAGRLILEKLPFLVLTALACALAMQAQRSVGALDTNLALAARLPHALVSYWVYIEKFFWPSGLAVFYPLQPPVSLWPAVGAVLALIAVTAFVILGRSKFPYLGVGWFWFIGTLIPVIGLIQIGMQATADRYTYVPYIGLALMLSWGLGDLACSWRPGQPLVVAAVAIALAGGLAAASRQVTYWANGTVLYQHAFKVTSGNYVAHSNMGNLLEDEGRLAEAAEHYKEVIRLVPTAAKPYYNLGTIYRQLGSVDDALRLFADAVKLDPTLALPHYALGDALLTKGKAAAAAAELREAVRLDPTDAKARSRLVEALMQSGQATDAIADCQAVAAAHPTDAHARFSLGWAYQQAKQPEQALVNYKEAVRLAPDNPECLNGLAWIYATCPRPGIRNGAEAVTLATRVCDMTKHKNTGLLDTLAAACAEAGRFDEAIKVSEEIRALALAAHDTNTEATARQRLELYKAGQPYRDEQ